MLRVICALAPLCWSAMDFSLSGKVAGVFKYIDQAVEPDKSNQTGVLEKQYQHLSSVIQRQGGSLAMDDSTAALQLLRSKECPFTAEQSKNLRSVIDTAGAPKADDDAPKDTFRKYTKCQEHVYIHNYLSRSKWEVVLADDVSINSIIEVVVDTCAEIGCLWPAPKPSQEWMVAFIHAVHGAKFTADEAFDTLHKFRDGIHRKRKNKNAGAPSGIAKYVELGSVFAESHPDAFPEGLPVPCEIPVATIKKALDNVVLRATNDRLTSNKRAAPKSEPSSSARSTGDDQMTPANFMTGVFQMMNVMMNGSVPVPDPQREPHARKRRQLLGLCDKDEAPPTGGLEAPTGGSESSARGRQPPTPREAANIDAGVGTRALEDIPAGAGGGGVDGLDAMLAGTRPAGTAKAGKGKAPIAPTPKAAATKRPPTMPEVGERVYYLGASVYGGQKHFNINVTAKNNKSTGKDWSVTRVYGKNKDHCQKHLKPAPNVNLISIPTSMPLYAPQAETQNG